ncbi:FAD-binding oxidoreductase [Shimia sp. SDUM112013]|uniref:NAD(P)/FAD-dependent oxidoreductase n=1 Tax=Shimia sp. SDUM112013 TaxID=3136160 RepID=UPI0032EF859D
MDLLYANDRKGQYPDSWYAATAEPLAPFPALKGEVRADVCVIGAGYTGLSTALHLAERGYDVVLLEAHRVGFGASGRNGGQLGSGQRMEQDGLEKLVGKEDAHKLWLLAEEAKQVTKGLIEKHEIPCHLKPGIAHACFTEREVREEHAYADYLRSEYGYSHLEKLDCDQFHAICPSEKYVGGSLDMSAAHLHPLAYALGLARAAAAAGVRIYENTHVHNMKKGARPVVQTDRGRVVADHVVLACNGYLGGLDRKVAARVMPINNFIAATRPLSDEELHGVLRRDVAIADTKFVINYFRLSHDKRLLFGGGESYGYKFPKDIDATVRKPMAEIYPQLKDIEFEYTWGGTLGITMKRMPFFARLAPNIISASGYSGHGVGTATHAGQLVAMAIAGQSEGFDTMARVPTPSFPGGSALRSPLLVLAMTWFAMRDRLGF